MAQQVAAEFVKQWYDAVESKKYDKIGDLLEEDEILLNQVIQTIRNLHYINYYISPTTKQVKIFNKNTNKEEEFESVGVVLLFKGYNIDSKTGKRLEVDGIDIFEVNVNNGKALSLQVMLRPLKSTLAVANEMKERLMKIQQQQSKL